MKLSSQHYRKSSPKKSSSQGTQGSPLRQRMREDMLLSNLSQKTQECYINGVLCPFGRCAYGLKKIFF
jgi:hypothetical protein